MQSETNEDNSWSDKEIDWGETITKFADGFYEIQIGYNYLFKKRYTKNLNGYNFWYTFF